MSTKNKILFEAPENLRKGFYVECQQDDCIYFPNCFFDDEERMKKFIADACRKYASDFHKELEFKKFFVYKKRVPENLKEEGKECIFSSHLEFPIDLLCKFDKNQKINIPDDDKSFI
jgi:hypothetical protein